MPAPGGFIAQAPPHAEARARVCPRGCAACGACAACRDCGRCTGGDAAGLAAGKRRIAFENLLLYQMAAPCKEAQRGFYSGQRYHPAVLAADGFAPTQAQERVLGQILEDMASARHAQVDRGCGQRQDRCTLARCARRLRRVAERADGAHGDTAATCKARRRCWRLWASAAGCCWAA